MTAPTTRAGGRRATLAEALLALVTSRERAASITGDLLERTASLPAFGRDLLSVASGLALTSVRRSPLRVLWLAACGLGLWLSVYASIRASSALVGLVPVAPRATECCAVPAGSLIDLAVMLAVSNWLAGFLLGYRGRDTELNACMPLAAVWAVAALALPALDWPGLTARWYCWLALPLLYLAPLLWGGALGARWRADETRRLSL